MEKLVSIVIPTYNREKTIVRAINSVLTQTYENIEVIVVDDCSTDHTLDEIKKIKDRRLRYVKVDKNSGACVARNIGVKHANGDLIAFQDSDDVWHTNKLAEQLKFMKKNNYEFVSCAFFRIDNSKKKLIGNIVCPNNSNQIYCELLDDNWVSTQTIVCYKYCFEKIAFDPKLKRYQDWDIALQAAKHFRVGHLNIPLVDVYMQDDSITYIQNGDESKLKVVEKQFEEINSQDTHALAQYYKSVADILRKYDLAAAAQNYKKSLAYIKNRKVFICRYMCLTKTMRIYETFIRKKRV